MKRMILIGAILIAAALIENGSARAETNVEGRSPFAQRCAFIEAEAPTAPCAFIEAEAEAPVAIRLNANAPAAEEAPEPVETEKPSETAAPTEAPTETPEPTETPTEAPAETESPAPTDSPLPSDSPAPTETPEPEKKPQSSAAPVRRRPRLETTAFDAVKARRLNVKRAPLVHPCEDTRFTRARDWLGVVATDEIGMPIPAKFQLDYPETIAMVGGVDRSVATSGCGATCLSMALEYLNGEAPDPAELFSKSIQDGKYRGYGWSAEHICHYARKYGVNARMISADADAICAAIEAGKPVIALMGAGIFTESGHYIVLRGIAENGKILINDPNSRSNTKKAFPLETLIRESKGETPFVICEK